MPPAIFATSHKLTTQKLTMTSIRSNTESAMSSNLERRMHDFPLLSRSLHDAEHDLACVSARTDCLARDVQTLAYELSPCK